MDDTQRAIRPSKSSAKKGKTQRWHNRRKEIIRTARKIFAERGYKAAKLEHVAEAMAMQRPSLHYYFTGKEDLYDAVLGEIIQAHLEQLKGIEDIADPALRLERIATFWLDNAVEAPDAARLLLEQFVDTDLPRTWSTIEPRKKLFELVMNTLNEINGKRRQKNNDPVLYILVQSAMSLLWVCMRDNMRDRLDYDTLAAPQLDRYRGVLVQLSRDLLNGRY